jgi:hypothetical protein
MAGIKGRFNQPRDRHTLAEFATLRIADCEQVMLIGPFGSITRANARLLGYVRAGLLNRAFMATEKGGKKALYFLSKRGALAAGVPYKPIKRSRDEMLVGDLFVEHRLAINSVYTTVAYRPIPIADAKLHRWIPTEEPISQTHPIIPDAYFEIAYGSAIEPMFLEVDLGTEVLKTWQKKTEAYLRLALSGEFATRFGQPRFRVLVVTRSERRLDSIRQTVATITPKIFYFTTFEAIKRDGFWSPIWGRPQGNERQSLL